MHCRHYIIGDIHNSIKEFNSIIDQIAPSRQDEIVLLGDAFDRGGKGSRGENRRNLCRCI